MDTITIDGIAYVEAPEIEIGTCQGCAFMEKSNSYCINVNCINKIYKKKEMTMKLKDLKPGMIVKYRNGNTRLVLSTDKNELFLASIGLGDRLCNIDTKYNSNLEHKDNSQFDIMAIYQPGEYEDIPSLLELSCTKCIWRRNEIKTVTMQEIADKFNIPIDQLRIKE